MSSVGGACLRRFAGYCSRPIGADGSEKSVPKWWLQTQNEALRSQWLIDALPTQEDLEEQDRPKIARVQGLLEHNQAPDSAPLPLRLPLRHQVRDKIDQKRLLIAQHQREEKKRNLGRPLQWQRLKPRILLG